jgi:hypothetical protein
MGLADANVNQACKTGSNRFDEDSMIIHRGDKLHTKVDELPQLLQRLAFFTADTQRHSQTAIDATGSTSKTDLQSQVWERKTGKITASHSPIAIS